jgi:hypothetical protein
MKIFLNSYYPIICTSHGKKAVKHYLDLHKLEDGSIRREPDFNSLYPGISGLCRPRSMKDIGLKKGDIVIYKTNTTHYLTAILKVIKKLNSHQEAKEWYEKNEIRVPSNCILMPHLPIAKSHAKDYLKKVGKTKAGDIVLEKNWDKGYQKRAFHHTSSYFFVTEPIYNIVQDIDENFIKVDTVLRNNSPDGKIPNTSFRPQKLSQDCYNDVLNLINK